MDMKYSLCDHYHLLYRSLKFLVGETQTETNEELISMMQRRIEKLNAFINLLAVVDPSLPLLRCQNALATFHRDVHSLFMNYRESRFLEVESAIVENTESIQSMWQLESDVKKDKFRAQAHDLYLNTLHATEQIIERHVHRLDSVSITNRILQYFEGLVDSVVEHLKLGDYELLFGAVNELYANLQMIHGAGDSHFVEQYEPVAARIRYLRKQLGLLKVYDDTHYRLKYYGYLDNEVQADLSNKMTLTKQAIKQSLDQIDTLKEDLVDYLSLQLWSTDAAGSSRASYRSKNLGEAFQ